MTSLQIKLQNEFEIINPTDSKYFQNKSQNGFKIINPTDSKFFQNKSQNQNYKKLRRDDLSLLCYEHRKR